MLAGGSAAMRSPLRLASHTVCATLIAAGKPLPAARVAALRADLDAMLGLGEFGVSQLKSVLVARYLGNSSELARRAMLCAWQHVRPDLMACAAVVPRIWNT